MITYSATWVCVKCGYLKRCEVTQHDTDKLVYECPPVGGCIQGLVYPGTDMEKCEWELIP
jgi:hypothetical protein